VLVYVSFGYQEYSGRAMEKAKEIDSKCRAEVGADKGEIEWK
jgi:hypothetical protein